jgi:hypothetical protein
MDCISTPLLKLCHVVGATEFNKRVRVEQKSGHGSILGPKGSTGKAIARRGFKERENLSPLQGSGCLLI